MLQSEPVCDYSLLYLANRVPPDDVFVSLYLLTFGSIRGIDYKNSRPKDNNLNHSKVP